MADLANLMMIFVHAMKKSFRIYIIILFNSPVRQQKFLNQNLQMRSMLHKRKRNAYGSLKSFQKRFLPPADISSKAALTKKKQYLRQNIFKLNAGKLYTFFLQTCYTCVVFGCIRVSEKALDFCCTKKDVYCLIGVWGGK